MKKVLSLMFAFVLVCMMFSGCNNQNSQSMQAPGTVVTTDEDAIRQVITDYYRAGFLWDYETMKLCVTSNLPVYDPYESVKSTYTRGVDNGFMVEADVDRFMELEREFQQGMLKKIQYRDWNISISGTVATVTLTVTPSGVDFEKIKAESGEVDYRDQLFTEVCGMDEITAKQTLSPEEFSTAHLRVQELEYQLWLNNLSTEGQKIQVQLEKADNCWKMSSIMPVV